MRPAPGFTAGKKPGSESVSTSKAVASFRETDVVACSEAVRSRRAESEHLWLSGWGPGEGGLRGKGTGPLLTFQRRCHPSGDEGPNATGRGGREGSTSSELSFAGLLLCSASLLTSSGSPG